MYISLLIIITFLYAWNGHRLYKQLSSVEDSVDRKPLLRSIKRTAFVSAVGVATIAIWSGAYYIAVFSGMKYYPVCQMFILGMRFGQVKDCSSFGFSISVFFLTLFN